MKEITMNVKRKDPITKPSLAEERNLDPTRRYLLSTANGRVFLWCENLARMPHMVDYFPGGISGNAASQPAPQPAPSGNAIADVVSGVEKLDIGDGQVQLKTEEVDNLPTIDLTKKPEPVDYEVRREDLGKLTKKEIAGQLKSMFGRVVNYQLSTKNDLIDMCITSEKNLKGDA
jgi:hypothetical protein